MRPLHAVGHRTLSGSRLRVGAGDSGEGGVVLVGADGGAAGADDLTCVPWRRRYRRRVGGEVVGRLAKVEAAVPARCPRGWCGAFVSTAHEIGNRIAALSRGG